MLTRFGLFIVWISGLTICVGILLYAFRTAPPAANGALKEHLSTLVGLFVPYLGPIIAFWFARDFISKAAPKNLATFYVAMVCSTIFNAAIIWALATILLAEGLDLAKVAAQLDLAQTLSTVLAFLVGPTIGFYFGKVD